MAGEIINSWEARLFGPSGDIEYIIVPSSLEPDGCLYFKTFGEAKRYWSEYFDGKIDYWREIKAANNSLKRDDVLAAWERSEFG